MGPSEISFPLLPVCMLKPWLMLNVQEPAESQQNSSGNFDGVQSPVWESAKRLYLAGLCMSHFETKLNSGQNWYDTMCETLLRGGTRRVRSRGFAGGMCLLQLFLKGH